ncbi:FMN-binding glutamate synthase family protein [Streptomyces griseus]|uniref:Glutamate synthase n=1 Tax=Streptomyces griseus subsp. griseus (strain JCM 4626 / CBS 651.72 / NBRC 13350 / KCC S-0626 / ISP 5235) TaxID=455632 RepID=B1W4L9_STRGG|nr:MULTISPECIES: FMN-binding glutamate synthase family protein [Streptomyces]MYR12527.1 FMN-binding glutamate synthase family protein [Streptomyces sp. SID724]MYR53867.1 FMN-binding glutamate synthase family protein [Streptomyces sp. SID4928]EGE45847.1 Glutamate synthase (NADPH) [Streptomyces sp. ACT-1]MBW3708792.1 FMN-binding glutamate synthase family protein [Streptomyces griseus]NEB51188.1 FMN-binding glutamate synthase family protein [Streptomyces griseus]
MRARSIGAAAATGLALVAARDLVQKKHALLRNFPLVGHARYALEKIGPELRQYIVTSNDEERPFSRDQRSWIYASAKGENNYFGFGTDNDIEHVQGYAYVKQRTFADALPDLSDPQAALPSAKVLGGPRGRAKAFRPASVINISAMSFGSLSAAAVTALNKGAALAGTMQNTGEGGLSPYHLNGGDLVLQIGTSYFGCRNEDGTFNLDKLKSMIADAPVKAIEIKLSQGAKPGLGGMLPGAKVSDEIARIRDIPAGEDCASPSRHTAFHDVDSMLDFVELLATETGLPVGIKSAIGEMDFWEELATLMERGDRGVDFVTVDGGEGGTGAAPLIFSDSVSLPFRTGFTRVYGVFAERGLTDDITFIGSGKLGLPEKAVVAFALGVDMINVGREAMLSIGCIQAQKCHTDKCPTGIATQNPWLARGIDASSKGERAAMYLRTLRKDLLKVSGAVGVLHPSLITPTDIDILNGDYDARSLGSVYGYKDGWGSLGPELAEELAELLST